MQTLSIIVPCYNEEKAAPIFYKEITKTAEELLKMEITCEFIFVDDGSKDGTSSQIEALSQHDDRVKLISFSRNFGKEAAIFAGMEHSIGDKVSIMDVDLQDPPHLLPEMVRGIDVDGYDCVATRRVTRKGEPPIRSFFAKMFYKLMNKISKTDIVDGARDYRVMTRQMVDSILEIKEYNRFSKGIFGWVGFKTKWVEYENIERVAGETKWSFWKLFVYSLDGIIAFSTVPLSIASVFGFIFCLISFILILFIVIKTLVFGDPAAGYPSMMCVIFLIGGIQLMTIGILGQYLAKTYLETKNRPIYIIQKSTNLSK